MLRFFTAEKQDYTRNLDGFIYYDYSCCHSLSFEESDNAGGIHGKKS